ncbi:MAG TPA: ankyrin repeat domain-containing protein [Bryobacteraceae bacterium]|nr:ankyrin repeat domain-containing protein [Bryobacteraceae bacterium]
MQRLYAAIRAGDAAQVQAAVDADPSLAIFAAAMQGDAARIEALLARHRSLVNAVSSDGWTPLHLAAHFGRREAARALMNKGADVSARSVNSMSWP